MEPTSSSAALVAQHPRKRRRKTLVCYLCGLPIAQRRSKDHVPPLQFFPKNLRSARNPNLITLQTHEGCNQSYKLDEDYFLHSIGPLAIKTITGGHLWNDIRHRLGKHNERHLGRLVSAEFEPRPSGIILPAGKVVKRLKPRIHRVTWKIARGAFFKETGRVLPERTPRRFDVVDNENLPGDHLHEVLSRPSRGGYPEVFDYKIFSSERLPFHQIAMLFWDAIAWVASFHDPSCVCEKCARSRDKGDVKTRGDRASG